VPVLSNAAFVDLLEVYMGLRLSSAARAEVLRYTNEVNVWDRSEAVLLMMIAPELHVA
jgi:hypothetical protein